MGREIETMVGNIKQVDISHQEMDRILKALEEMYTETKANAPELEWMPVQGVGNLLCHELGYEDTAEFEDAMGGTFKEFLSNFPIIELRDDDRVAGGVTFKVKPDPPVEEWEPTKHTVRINKGDDLWRICHKSKYARLCVPSLEFEVQADGQRHIDSLYNHIGNAITNLAAHCSSMGAGLSDDHKQKILETVEGLTELLDVAEPWSIELYDPTGVSEILPATEVAIERYDPGAD